MTRYLINSGGIKNSADQGAKFYNDIVQGLGSKPKVLLCMFAQPREDWEVKFDRYAAAFQKVLEPGIEPRFTLASPGTFENQLAQCGAVYLLGGDDHLFQYWMWQFDLPALWERKTVASNSASSHGLSTHFWTCDWRQCMDGLGILPIKFIAHYQSGYGQEDPRGPVDWEAGYAELAEYGDKSLPIYALAEGDYRVFEQ